MTNQTYWHIAGTDEHGVPRCRTYAGGVFAGNTGAEIRVGETLTHVGEIKVCKSGYHMCPRLVDCLNYAKGTVICKVVPGDIVIAGEGQHADKIVSNARTVVAMTSATEGERILREFARWCALQVIHLWDAPDIVRQYLETGDESIRDAARSAAESAAWDAARSAAESAAWDAAWYAAWSAAWDAAWYAAWDAQNEKLIDLVEAAFAGRGAVKGDIEK